MSLTELEKYFKGERQKNEANLSKYMTKTKKIIESEHNISKLQERYNYLLNMKELNMTLQSLDSKYISTSEFRKNLGLLHKLNKSNELALFLKEFTSNEVFPLYCETGIPLLDTLKRDFKGVKRSLLLDKYAMNEKWELVPGYLRYIKRTYLWNRQQLWFEAYLKDIQGLLFFNKMDFAYIKLRDMKKEVVNIRADKWMVEIKSYLYYQIMLTFLKREAISKSLII